MFLGVFVFISVCIGDKLIEKGSTVPGSHKHLFSQVYLQRNRNRVLNGVTRISFLAVRIIIKKKLIFEASELTEFTIPMPNLNWSLYKSASSWSSILFKARGIMFKRVAVILWVSLFSSFVSELQFFENKRYSSRLCLIFVLSLLENYGEFNQLYFQPIAECSGLLNIDVGGKLPWTNI